jgi:hypothetical protein
MKPHNAGFVNPFRNIYFKFVLASAVAALTEIVPSATPCDSHWQPVARNTWRVVAQEQRCVRSVGNDLPYQQTDVAQTYPEVRTLLRPSARFFVRLCKLTCGSTNGDGS